MLTEKYILSLIEQYSKTPEGKAEIAKKHKGKFIPRTADKQTGIQDTKEMKKAGEDMKRILFSHISKVIESFRIEDIIVGEPIQQGDDYYLNISFNEDALRRESLAPDLYPEGVYDIVQLFVKGYNARGSVHGVWKGHGDEEIWSLRSREPNDFMEQAVNEFNSKYRESAQAELKSPYKN